MDMNARKKEFDRDELVALVVSLRDTNSRRGPRDEIAELEGKYSTLWFDMPSPVRSEEQQRAKDENVRKTKQVKKPKRLARNPIWLSGMRWMVDSARRAGRSVSVASTR